MSDRKPLGLAAAGKGQNFCLAIFPTLSIFAINR